MRKKFYRQAKKAICIATLSATVLSSIPMIPYTQAYAKDNDGGIAGTLPADRKCSDL